MVFYLATFHTRDPRDLAARQYSAQPATTRRRCLMSYFGRFCVEFGPAQHWQYGPSFRLQRSRIRRDIQHSGIESVNLLSLGEDCDGCPSQISRPPTLPPAQQRRCGPSICLWLQVKSPGFRPPASILERCRLTEIATLDLLGREANQRLNNSNNT